MIKRVVVATAPAGVAAAAQLFMPKNRTAGQLRYSGREPILMPDATYMPGYRGWARSILLQAGFEPLETVPVDSAEAFFALLRAGAGAGVALLSELPATTGTVTAPAPTGAVPSASSDPFAPQAPPVGNRRTVDVGNASYGPDRRAPAGTANRFLMDRSIPKRPGASGNSPHRKSTWVQSGCPRIPPESAQIVCGP